MNDYSGSLALQTVGVRLRRPVSACVVTVLAFGLILWLHHGAGIACFVAFIVTAALDAPFRLRGPRPGRPTDGAHLRAVAAQPDQAAE
jgi:nucleobase:cation symporter-1, NCS1 family